MSRGPGCVQRAIEAAFARSPSETFTVEELGAFAYPGLNRVEKRHRVSILRAGYAAMRRTNWGAFTSERPGGHIVFYNPLDITSYAVARMRADFLYYYEPMSEIMARLDDEQHRKLMQRDTGAWWQHVELARALHRGDSEAAAVFQKQADDRFAAFW
jgi:hypothetical protein